MNMTTEPVDGNAVTEAVVGTLPIAEVLPFGELRLQLRIIEIDCEPELLELRRLHPLDLAVEVR